jgi:hypothetical protein
MRTTNDIPFCFVKITIDTFYHNVSIFIFPCFIDIQFECNIIRKNLIDSALEIFNGSVYFLGRRIFLFDRSFEHDGFLNENFICTNDEMFPETDNVVLDCGKHKATPFKE